MDLSERVEIDRIHRALGPRLSDPARPRYVICRLHHYIYKETIICGAWEAGEIDFDGATLKILPDVSRDTLLRRAKLRPLLELARRLGFTYNWEHPLSVTFKKEQRSFSLRTPESLPDLFFFPGSNPQRCPKLALLSTANVRKTGSFRASRQLQTGTQRR